MESLQSIPSEPVYFRPGGVFEKLGGMIAHFGDVEIQIIASPDNPRVGFITGLKGKDTASVIEEIVAALKNARFESIEYRADNEDGRGEARTRLFESLKKKIVS